MWSTCATKDKDMGQAQTRTLTEEKSIFEQGKARTITIPYSLNLENFSSVCDAIIGMKEGLQESKHL